MSIRDRLFMPRTEEEKLVRELGKRAYEEMARDASMLTDQARRVATAYGIDPKYLLYLLVHQPNTWEPLVGTSRNALQRAIDLAVDRDNGMRFDDYTIPPETKESDVDRALVDMGDWASTTFVKQMALAYTSTLRNLVPDTQAVIERAFGEKVNANEAYLWLHETFKHTLEKKAFNFFKRMWLALILPEFE